jgi:hypothetical protein
MIATRSFFCARSIAPWAALFVAGTACSAPPPSGAPDEATQIAAAALTCDYSVLTAHNDISRTGNQTCESSITPSNLPFMGDLAGAWLPGPYVPGAQPLVLSGNSVNGQVRDVVIAAAAERVYVLDALTLAPIFITPVAGNGLGIMSTPVIDKAANVLYVVEGDTDPGQPEWKLLAFTLDDPSPNTAHQMTRLATTTISGQCAGGSTSAPPSPFAAGTSTGLAKQFQRPALLLDHGHVYIAFGAAPGGGNAGEGGGVDYNGWIFAYNTLGSGQTSQTAAGSPYCVTRTAVTAVPDKGKGGMGGIWQFQAGLSADSTGNVYAATGNGFNNTAASDPIFDSSSYVSVAGASWTGKLRAKYTDPEFLFLNDQDLDVGSTGPVLLPGPGSAQTVVGAGKQGKLRFLTTALSVTAGPMQAGLNQYAPILSDQNNVDPSTVSCMAAACDSTGFPSFNPGPNPQVCCPSGCEGLNNCQNLVLGSHPHIHGQPVYGNGALFWWAEKDYPKFIAWNASSGTFGGSGVITQVSNTDVAPGQTSTASYEYGAMPGGLMSMSSNGGSSNAILWAMAPNSKSPSSQVLRAFDVSSLGALPKTSAWSENLGLGSHSYPTIANGIVYVDTSPGKGPDPNVPRLRSFKPFPAAVTWAPSAYKYSSFGQHPSAAIGWPVQGSAQPGEWVMAVDQANDDTLEYWAGEPASQRGQGFGSDTLFGAGWAPSVATQAGAGQLEVYQATSGLGNLMFQQYLWGTGYGLSTSNAAQTYDHGFHPSVAMGTDSLGNADTTVVEVHQQDTTAGNLWYHTGKWTSGMSGLNGASYYDHGAAPSVAYMVTTVGQTGTVIEVHQQQDGFGPLWYRTGTLAPGSATINWLQVQQYDQGEAPSVAVCGNKIIEVHQGQDAPGALWFRSGTLQSNGIISWSNSQTYDTGYRPSIACDSYSHTGIELHQAGTGYGALWAHPFVF